MYIFKTPGVVTGHFNSFVMERIFYDTHDDIVWMDWSADSRCIVVGSKDNSLKVYGVTKMTNFRPYILSGHSDEIVSCSFEEKNLDLNSVSRNGQLCIYKCSLDPSELQEIQKINFKEEPEEKKKKSDDDEEEDEIDATKAIEKSLEEISLQTKSITEKFHDSENQTRDSLGNLIVKQEKSDKFLFSYQKTGKHYLMDELKKQDFHVKLTAASYHKKMKLLITAYSSGAFFLHELPDANLIHSLNISEHSIESVSFNNSGDWVALGVPGAGQLLVWEWQSEQYIMKQQGHSSLMNCISYSADGNYIVSGGQDGKIKVWNVQSGFCFITFSEHTSAVTSLKFSQNKKFFVSASLDGTVRAFDMNRYRNFRTFTAPRLIQFSCVAVDASGELVAAGAQDVFDIHLWSMKFGKLLEVMSGHEGPVMALNFSPSPTSSALVSGAWDKVVKIWDCLETSSSHESIETLSDVVCVAFKPDGEAVAVATLNATISIFNVKTAQQLQSIECRHDVGISKQDSDIISAKKNAEAKYFSTIVFSADGECLLAGGLSKYVCIYHVKESLLLKKFEISQNFSLDGMNEYINRKNLTDFGNAALIEKRDVLEGGNVKLNLPGTKKNDVTSRSFHPEVGVYSLEFSPNGQQWSAATTEGLLVYSLDKGIVFDPYQLSVEVTPKMTRTLLEKEEFANALVMSLKLNETELIQEVMEKIPHREIPLILDSLPDNFVHRTIDFVTKMLNTPHLEFYLKWTTLILTKFGQKTEILSPKILINLQQNLNRKYETLQKICDFNKFTIRVVKKIASAKKQEQELKDESDEEMDDDEDDDNMVLVRRNESEQDMSTDEDDTSEE